MMSVDTAVWAWCPDTVKADCIGIDTAWILGALVATCF